MLLSFSWFRRCSFWTHISDMLSSSERMRLMFLFFFAWRSRSGSCSWMLSLIFPMSFKHCSYCRWKYNLSRPCMMVSLLCFDCSVTEKSVLSISCSNRSSTYWVTKVWFCTSGPVVQKASLWERYSFSLRPFRTRVRPLDFLTTDSPLL